MMNLPAVVIGAQDLASGTTLKGWSAKVARIVQRQKGCAQPRSTEMVIVGADTAALLNYPDCPKSSGLYDLWAVVVHGNRGYQIVWFNNSGHEAEDRLVIDRMLASQSFTS